MKKSVYVRKKVRNVSGVLVAAFVLLTGCHEKDEVSVPVPVKFTVGIDGQVSRAAGTAFAVGDQVGISGTSGSVAYTNREYRATSSTMIVAAGATDSIYFNNNDEVTFTAYYPFTGAVGTVPGAVTVTTGGTEQAVPGDQAKFDFLYATAKGSKASPNVALNFTHRMSQIVLTIEKGDGVTSLERVKGYKITGLKLEGTFDPATGAVATTATGAAPLEVPLTATSTDKEVKSTLIVFPQAATNVEFSMTFSDPNDGDEQTYTGTMDIPVGGFVSGTSYAYIVNVSKTGLTVSKASIGEWTTGDEKNMTAK